METGYEHLIRKTITANNSVTVLCARYSSKLTIINLGGKYYYLHFTDEETKAQRNSMAYHGHTLSKRHSWDSNSGSTVPKHTLKNYAILHPR